MKNLTCSSELPRNVPHSRSEAEWSDVEPMTPPPSLTASNSTSSGGRIDGRVFEDISDAEDPEDKDDGPEAPGRLVIDLDQHLVERSAADGSALPTSEAATNVSPVLASDPQSVRSLHKDGVPVVGAGSISLHGSTEMAEPAVDNMVESWQDDAGDRHVTRPEPRPKAEKKDVLRDSSSFQSSKEASSHRWANIMN